MRKIVTFTAALGLAAFAGTTLVPPTALAPAAAQEDTYKSYFFGTNTKYTSVGFVSDTAVETINGKTNQMSGRFYVSFDEMTGKCRLTVPVKHLKTGIEKRDEHVQNDSWLDAEKYPDITFVSNEITLSSEGQPAGTYKAKVKGKLTIHGVTKERAVEASVVRVNAKVGERLGPGEWVKVTTAFEVPIKEHGITGHTEDVIGTKVAPTWKVNFSCFATTERPDRR